MNIEQTKLAALSAIIGEDLGAIERLDMELGKLSTPLSVPRPEFRDLAAVAYVLHNLYNALENAFGQISRTFENHVTDPAVWLKELLGKMFLEIPTVRPAVLPGNLRGFLNDLRAFRHLFRHAYDFELNPEKLSRLAQDWMRHKGLIISALAGFREHLMAQVKALEASHPPNR
jgi:hypothetical protein